MLSGAGTAGAPNRRRKVDEVALTGKRSRNSKRRAGEAADEAFGLSLPQQIAKVIAGEIVERKLSLGQRLPELGLADRFGTSRAPIREALYILAQEGLVERTPRRGAFVRQFDRQEIEELYRVRGLLEGLALDRIFREPGSARQTECVSALELVVHRMAKVRKEIRAYHELNFEFHMTIIEVSGSDLLLNLYRQIEGPLKVFLRLSLETPGAVALSLDEHRQLLGAISEGDVERASELLVRHDRDGMQRAMNSLSPPDPE
jgi:DNA-binding GntR family transcriptional regulator